MHKVETLESSGLTGDDIEQMAELSCLCFPDAMRTKESRVEALASAARTNIATGTATSFYFVRAAGRIVAAARIMPREIGTARGIVPVAGLGGVMTHPTVRGQGLGKVVVRAAFGRVDSGEFPYALFQTGPARQFYERLGCCVIDNSLVNSRNLENPHANPLWDPYPMRYPCTGDWPRGKIDLLGPAW